MTEITIKAMLKWLDGQRDAVNARIIAAPPENQGRYMPELQVINAIAERVREMTAVEYLTWLYMAWEEMNITHDKKRLREIIRMHIRCPERAVAAVKRWKEERDG